MAATRLWTTLLLLHAAFILLSGASTETRCYWCGPLAEQVHRSRRSAPCGASDPVTVCEPGYNYCAVVATAPPRIESRYCVKIYQDECYPLYCNSTKTWKMTCPCRGDLCNGPNTEREDEAFAVLPKLVAKTHNARIKKRTANASPHFIKYESKKKIINHSDVEIHNISNLSFNESNNVTHENKLIVTENDENLFQPGNVQSDQPINIMVEHHSEDDAQRTVADIYNKVTTDVNNQLIEIEIHVSDPTETSDTMKGNEKQCTDSVHTVDPYEDGKSSEPVKEAESSIATPVTSVFETEVSMKATGMFNTVESETAKPTEIMQNDAVDTKSTDKPQGEVIANDQPMSSIDQMQNDAVDTKSTDKPQGEVIANDQPMSSIDQMQNDAPLVSPTDSVQMKTTEVTKVDEPPTKGTVTAEALQQDGSPSVAAAPVPVTEKPTAPTTTETRTVPTILTTRKSLIQTTTPAHQRKNNSIRILFSYTLILLVCLIHFQV